jgi:hypothetical protein
VDGYELTARAAPVLTPDQFGVARTVIVADVQDSGVLNNAEQRHMRSVLEHIYRKGVAALGAHWGWFDPVDRGDGLILVVPPVVGSPAQVLNILVPAVAAELRAVDNEIRLRMAIHHGFLDRTDGRWSGRPLVHGARLTAAAGAKRILNRTNGARLALIVSDLLYGGVVCHGYSRIGPDRFTRVRVKVKETTADAWVNLW